MPSDHKLLSRDVPDFMTNHLVHHDWFVDIYKKKTCLAFTKNLKLFEFHRKNLVACIDLNNTCLSQVKEELGRYKSSIGNLDSPEDDVCESENVTSDVCFGKYVYHTLNYIKVYIIVQCWTKCVIIERLPNNVFIFKTQYEYVHSFRITHGSIKYCPVLEIELQNKETIRTDFEDKCQDKDSSEDFTNKKAEFKQLLDRARSAKTELQLHKCITAQAFERLQSRLTYGAPSVRSFKLEEKQMLARCGDIWKRLTAQNDVVIGIPLVNQCSAPNLTVLYNLRPILQCNPSSEIVIDFKLFQLKQIFTDLDTIEMFLQSEDEQLQKNVWSADNKSILLPESYVILVIKFKMSQVIAVKQCPLLLHYEVVPNSALQIFLGTIDFHEILFEQQEKFKLTLQCETIQQDFLTIAISSMKTCLKITFQSYTDLDIFEKSLKEKFFFEKLPTFCEEKLQHTVFYNSLRDSLWFSCLILRYYDIEENEHDNCITSWKFYCPQGEKTMLFMKIMFNDLITSQCNVLAIANLDKTEDDGLCNGQFEDIMRQELHALKQLSIEPKTNFENWSRLFIEFGKAQLRSDSFVKKLKCNIRNE